MANLGSLVVSLEANMAKFQSDMGKSAYVTEQAMLKMQKSADIAKAAIVGLAVGAVSALSVNMFVNMVKGAIDAADHLNDLSKKTGIAVGTLGGLGFAAGQAGGDLESVTAAAGKLNKAIAEAAGGNKEFGTAFGALGISITDATGRLKTADVVMAEVADKFAGYEDGPAKAAIALRLFGKAGADIIPLLNDGGTALRENIDYYKRYSGVTQEVADKADAFNDTMGKIHLLQGAFSRSLASELLPTLQSIADEFLRAKENGDGFKGLMHDVAGDIAEVVRQLIEGRKEAGSFWGAIMTFGTINPFASQESNIKSYEEDIDSLTKALERYKRAGSDTSSIETALAEVGKKLKFVREQQIAAAISAASGYVSNDMLDSEVSRPSVKNPKKQQAPILPGKGLADEAAALAKKQLDGQLKTLENALTKERDAIQFHEQYVAEQRNQDLVGYQKYFDERKKAIESGLAVTVRTYDAEIAALEKYKASADKKKDQQEAQNKIDDLAAKKEKARQDAMQKSEMLTLGLSKAQNELNKDMKEWAIQQRLSSSYLQFEIEMMGKSSIEVAKLTAERQIQLDVEERIRQAKKNGPISDESIAAIQAAAAIAKARTTSLLDQQDAKSKDPWFNAQESIRKYGEEASNTGAQIGSAMTNAFKSAEDALTNFVMTGKLGIGDLVKSVLAGLVRIQAQKAVASISSGISSTLLPMLGSLFAGGAGMATTGVDGLSLASNPFAMSAFADGGDPPIGRPSIVGERGPELFVPRAAGTVVPNELLGGGGRNVTINQNINIESGTDRAAIRADMLKVKEATKAEIFDEMDRR